MANPRASRQTPKRHCSGWCANISSSPARNTAAAPDVRRLHRAHRRQASALVPDPLSEIAGQESDDHRGARATLAIRCRKRGSRAGAAMRLLPVRADHAGRRIAAKNRSRRANRSSRIWTATSAAAAPIARSSPPFRASRREGGHHVARYQRTGALAPSFLVSTGAFSIAAPSARARHGAAAAAFNPNAWVTIGEDNIVTIVAPTVEMGQGVAHVAAAHSGRRPRRRLEPGAHLERRRTMTRSTAIRSSTTSSRRSEASRSPATTRSCGSPARRRARS